MRHINEYLLSKNKSYIKCPTEGCSLEDICKWFDYLGVPDTYNDRLYYVKRPTYVCLFAKNSKHNTREIDINIDNTCEVIADNHCQYDCDFNKCIEIIKLLIDNPDSEISVKMLI